VTETRYFEALGRTYRKTVKVVVAKQVGVPHTLLSLAKREKVEREGDELAEHDQFWIVFDRDEHPKVQEVISEAAQSGIGVAFSNPCFEMWLILHFQDSTKHIERREAAKLLRKYMQNYEKEPDVVLLFDNDYALFPAAKDRAQKLLEQHQRDGKPLANPVSTVFGLVDCIRDPV
jgi:RloB-like protein